ncbi:hypothetical protein AB0B45_15680 [Nonomuraea sp. NPDC049152]
MDLRAVEQSGLEDDLQQPHLAHAADALVAKGQPVMTTVRVPSAG